MWKNIIIIFAFNRETNIITMKHHIVFKIEEILPHKQKSKWLLKAKHFNVFSTIFKIIIFLTYNNGRYYHNFYYLDVFFLFVKVIVKVYKNKRKNIILTFFYNERST